MKLIRGLISDIDAVGFVMYGGVIGILIGYISSGNQHLLFSVGFVIALLCVTLYNRIVEDRAHEFIETNL